MADIVVPDKMVPQSSYLSHQKVEKFKYLRGAKKIKRTNSNGFSYIYSEGKMSEYDNLTLPARTLLTSEGTINRSSHLLKINNRYRLLTPIEAERLQSFPDDWTKYKRDSNGKLCTVSDRRRFFLMGNALITNIVTTIANELKLMIEENDG